MMSIRVDNFERDLGIIVDICDICKFRKVKSNEWPCCDCIFLDKWRVLVLEEEE